MGKGRVFKRGAIWWIQYNVNGRQYRETGDTTRKENAEALLRRRLQEVWEGRFFPGARKQTQLTMGGLLALWLAEKAGKASIGDDKTRLGAGVAHFGEHRLISTVTADDVAEWRDELAGDLEVATVNRHLAVLRSALNLAASRGHVHQDPMAGVQLGAEDNARDRICSEVELRKLVAAAPADLGACIVVGYWCGMRLGEIVNLPRERLDLDAGLLRLATASTKERTAKVVPLPADVVAALKTLPTRLDGRVFAFNRDWYSRQFGLLAASLDIVDLHFHDLRHTALTNMADAGVDIMTMAAISGHKTLEMLKRYVHRRPAALKEAMAKVEAHAAGRERS